MGLRINTNIGSLAAQRLLKQSSHKLDNTMKALASGERFSNPAESPADFAIAENLRGQITGMQAATKNADTAASFVQVAEGGLNEQNNMLIRMRELAIQAASDTVSDNEREMLQDEYGQLTEEIDRIAKSTSFGSQKLLNGETRDYEFQVGAYKGEENTITYKSDANTTSSELNVDGTMVTDKSDARDALENIDGALEKIARARANFGATQSRLESVVNNGHTQVENLTDARSKMADTDVGKAVSDMYRLQALQQYQVQVLSEANRFPMSIIKLIG